MANDVSDILIEMQFNTHDLSDCFSSEIVMGRPEATAHDHRIRFVEHAPKMTSNATDVVANFDLRERVETVHCKVFAEPRRIRINNLSEK